MTDEVELKTNFFSDMMDKEERRRLDRQLRLPGWNQETLKSSTVLIAGVGGLGTEIAKNLAMAGVGKLHLVDLDIIEYSNLNRQILFNDADEGEPKAKIAATNLKKINPFGKYIWHHGALEDLDPAIYAECDLYIAGLDSVNARRELNRRAVHNGKPMIDGGTTTYYGHIYTYLPKQNACLDCDPMREPEREDLAACTLVGIPRKHTHCLLKGQLYFESKFERPPNSESVEEMTIVLDYANELVKKHFPHKELFDLDKVVQLVDHHDPTIITINAVVASLQSQEGLKVLHHVKGINLGVVNQEYVIYNGLTGKFFYLPRTGNKKCMICGPNAPKIEKIELPASTTFDLMRHIIKKRGYDFDPEFPPSFYRIDTRDMDILDDEETLQEAGIRSGETLFLSDVKKNGKEQDIYVRVTIKKR